MSRIRGTAYLVLGWFVLAACLAMFAALLFLVRGCGAAVAA